MVGIIKVGGEYKTWKYFIVTGIQTFVTYWKNIPSPKIGVVVMTVGPGL